MNMSAEEKERKKKEGHLSQDAWRLRVINESYEK